MKKMETRTLVEASLLSALAAVIMIASIYIPFFSLVGAFIWPIPITLLSFKYSIRTSLLSLVVSLAIAAMVTSPVNALTMGLSYGLTAIVLGFCLRKNYAPFVTIMAMAVSTFAGYFAVIELTNVFTGVDLMKQFYTLLDESVKKSIEIAKSMGTTDEQIKNSPISSMTSENIKLIFPGMTAIASAVGSYMTYYLVQVIFKRLRINVRNITPFDKWYVGSNFGLGLFLMILASILMLYLKVPNANIVYSSIYSIMSFTFEVSGLSLLIWFLKSKGIPKGFQILIGVFLVFGQLAIILVLLGLADYMMDFRKINPARRRRISPGNKNE